MEKENGYMQQHINWKKLWLLFWERIWLIVALTISCAAIAAGIYQVVRTIRSEGQFYRVSSDYYLTFNLDHHSQRTFFPCLECRCIYLYDKLVSSVRVVNSILKKK